LLLINQHNLNSQLFFFSESGPDSTILPANKVVVNPHKKWVEKFFQPLTVPDQSVGVGKITKNTISPTSIGWLI